MSDGDNTTYYVWAKDSAGNISSSPVDNFTIIADSTAPTIAGINLYDNVDNSSDNTTGTVKIEFDNATDSLAGTYKYYASEGSTFSDDSSNWKNIVDNDTFSLALTDQSSGTRTVNVWIIDRALNVSNATSDTITLLDVTAPTVAAVTLYDSDDDNSTTADSGSLNVDISSTDNFKVKSYYISDNSSDNLSAVSFTDFSTASHSVVDNATWTLSGERGTLKTIYVWTKDFDNNTSSPVSDNITLADTTAPTITSVTLINRTDNNTASITADNQAKLNIVASDTGTATTLGLSKYYVSDNASDNDSVILAGALGSLGNATSINDNYTISFDNSTLDNGSTLTLYVWTIDAANNISAPVSDNITYYR